MERGTFVEIEHTADLGLDLEGPSPESILEAAQRGLIQLLLADTSGLEPDSERDIAISAAGYPELLKAWCERLYRLLEDEGFVALSSLVCPEPALPDREPAVGCRALVRGVVPPAERRVAASELKAVTYHQLAFAPAGREAPGRWRARVIFDV